ncbi:MAG: hypothetical protein J5932_05705 [Prevotella sp.]|nr:hypothetical protein [Prevotella sp.]
MAKYDLNIREEELKHKVARDWFGNYDTTQIIDNIDFAVAIQPVGNELFKETEYLLWAEAKKGNKQNIYDSVVQLIFTIGKGRINERHMPPKFIGAFDAEKIAFIPYNAIMEVFSQTDFNWNVPPSDHNTKEFLQLKTMVRNALEQSSLEDGNEAYRFDFAENRKELKTYISKNFKTDYKTNRGMRITHNNFVAIYNQWRKEVMPTISINWEKAKEHGLIDADFYLADLMSGKDNYTIPQKLRVLLHRNEYMLKNGINYLGKHDTTPISFRDDMQAHKTFWARYARPPKEVYWDKIVDRRDLLVPQDIRERKGSYFTPSIWVEKSQEYLAAVLGENWQDEYYIWDCCAGTGNLLANLTNKYNIWASTLDLGDVQVMHERIASMEKSNPNGSNLLGSHVFQFDFLNDDFSRLPQGLQDIINDEEKRKKLVIYINPPYAEAGNAKQRTDKEKNKPKTGVSVTQATYDKYLSQIGIAGRELFAQFFIRIYQEIPSCRLAEFSKLKILQAPNFVDFRSVFRAKLESLFIVPANTFDNVKGQFPIGFFIWDTDIKTKFNGFEAQVYDALGNEIGKKLLFSYDGKKNISDWIIETRRRANNTLLGFMSSRSDVQNINVNFIINSRNQLSTPRGTDIYEANLMEICVFYSVNHTINATWLNDRDQFLYPRKAWKEDKEFQCDCLAYTLFNTNIQSQYGINHWIPFTEAELKAPDTFQSHFMSDFIAGKCKNEDKQQELEYAKVESFIPTEPIQFSPEAQAVMDAGRELWYYYMHHKDGELYGAQSINVNASYYDIRRYFQGTDDKGRMNPESKDETYMRLWGNIKEALKVLAKKIEPKVYLYGFLLDETTLPEDEPEAVEEVPLPTP